MTPKSVVDVYGRDVIVDVDEQKLSSYNNKAHKIMYTANVIKDGKKSEFFTDYMTDGDVVDVVERLKTWNNKILLAYSYLVNFEASKYDPDREKWNAVIDYVKKNQEKFFDKYGDWKKDFEVSIEDIKEMINENSRVGF